MTFVTALYFEVLVVFSILASCLAMFTLVWVSVSLNNAKWEIKHLNNQLEETKAVVDAIKSLPKNSIRSIGPDDELEAIIAERSRKRAEELMQIMREEEKFYQET